MRKISKPMQLLSAVLMISFSFCKKENIKPDTVSENTPVSQQPSASLPAKDPAAPSNGTSKVSFMSVTGVPVYKENGGNNAIFYQTGMTIDADGAYKCYHADNNLALSN